MANQRHQLFLLVAGICSALLMLDAASAQTVEVVNAFVRVHREVEIPAREPGVLQILEVEAGDLIRRGDIIGRKVTDKSVQDDMKNWPFKVIAGPEDRPLISARHNGDMKSFRPEEISSMVLTKMKEVAESYLG